MNFLHVMNGKYTINPAHITRITWEPEIPGAMVHVGRRKFYLEDEDFYALAEAVGYQPPSEPKAPKVMTEEEALADFADGEEAPAA